MKSTVITLKNGRSVPETVDEPSLQPFTNYGGLPVTGATWYEVASQDGTVGLSTISPGGHFPTHEVHTTTIVNVVQGRGRIAIGDEPPRRFVGPELFVFAAGTVHDWHDIEEHTLMILVSLPTSKDQRQP